MKDDFSRGYFYKGYYYEVEDTSQKIKEVSLDEVHAILLDYGYTEEANLVDSWRSSPNKGVVSISKLEEFFGEDIARVVFEVVSDPASFS